MAGKERNPYHEPAGSSEGGRFASGPSGKGKRKEEFSQFDTGVQTTERAAWKAAGLGDKSTKQLKTDPKTGEYTEEVQKEHESIVDFLLTYEKDEEGNWVKKEFTSVPEGEERMVTLFGGGSGSGKTTLEKYGMISIDPNTIRANSDMAKTMIAEFQDAIKTGTGIEHIASIVHDESSDIVDLLIQRANEGNYNLLLDGTGNNSWDKLVEKVTQLTGPNGDPVHAIYTNADVESSWARNVARFGRNPERGMVPATYFFGNHSNVSLVFPQAIRENLFASYQLWDNRGKRGEAYLVISGTTSKDSIIHNQSAWDAFLAKYLPEDY